MTLNVSLCPRVTTLLPSPMACQCQGHLGSQGSSWSQYRRDRGQNCSPQVWVCVTRVPGAPRPEQDNLLHGGGGQPLTCGEQEQLDVSYATGAHMTVVSWPVPQGGLHLSQGKGPCLFTLRGEIRTNQNTQRGKPLCRENKSHRTFIYQAFLRHLLRLSRAP